MSRPNAAIRSSYWKRLANWVDRPLSPHGMSLIRSLGYTCSDRTLNGVDYVRCEDAWDFPGLAKKILTDLYGVDEKQSLTLIIMGFEWETPA